MVMLAVSDKKERIIQRRKRRRLLNILESQKKSLKNHFTLKKEESASRFSRSSLNFAVDWEVSSEEKTCKEPTDKINQSQINLARSMAEGEDISSFPPEWQEFLLENEGKEPVEKLNKMLADGNK